MKFSEKLSKLRKEVKMSQQELAEYLDVSRQAVSKWESGISYPEMDKLLVLCKLFKCSLDDLTNDEVSELKVETNNNHSNIFFDFLDLIVKTFDMFRCMKFKQIIECIFSMSLLVIGLLLLLIPGAFIYTAVEQIISYLTPFHSFFNQVWSFICIFIYSAFFFMTFFYIFKKRYLDNFKEADKIVITNNNKEIVYEKKDNVLTFVPTNNDNAFIKLITKIFIICFKGIFILFLIPFIFSFVALFSSFVIDILLLFKGVIYIGVTLGIIFCILFNYVVLELSYDFLFNKKIAFKRIFIMIIASLAGIGVSVGILAIEISDTKYISESLISDNKYILKTLKYDKDMYLVNSLYRRDDTYEYVVDDSLKDEVIIEGIYDKNYRNIEIMYDNESKEIYDYPFESTDLNTNKLIIDMLIKDLSKKQVHNYSSLYDYKIIIRGSAKVIETIKKNNKIKEEEFEKKQQESYYESQIDSYEEQISQYEKEISDLNDSTETLKEENEDLKLEIETLKEKIKEYKENLNNLLKE